MLFDVYRLSGKEKYRKAIDTLYGQILRQPRTHEGNFWHKAIYPNQVWLDGLYMAQVFHGDSGEESVLICFCSDASCEDF